MPKLVAPFGFDEIIKFYGWEPRFMNDLPSWEARMVVVHAPLGAEFLFGTQHASGIRVHGKIANEFEDRLIEVRNAGLWDYLQHESGGYNFRLQKGSNSKLSMHCFGAAIDFDAEHNPLGRPAPLTRLGSEPGLEVVRIFQRGGWTWGGEWGRPDSMHLQFGGGF